MKKLYFTLLVTFLSFTANAQELTWHTDVDQATAIATKSKKPLLLFFTGSDWCGWCIRLQKEVFTKPEFAKWANENVVLLELDFPRKKQVPADIMQKNRQLEQMFAVRGYPTVWLVDLKNNPTTNKVEMEKLGATGYVAGGPTAWLQGANQILQLRK